MLLFSTCLPFFCLISGFCCFFLLYHVVSGFFLFFLRVSASRICSIFVEMNNFSLLILDGIEVGCLSVFDIYFLNV